MSKLEIDSVVFAYGDKVILKDIYLSCQTGEVVGLIGRNGSGKSTLMKVLFGSLKGESQSVRLNSGYVNPLYKQKGAAYYLPQDGFAMNYLTFERLSELFCLEERVDDILMIDEVNSIRKEKIGELSTGMRKLVEVMIILNAKSEFCILDEPFSFLSPVMVEWVIALIEKRSENMGIILTDHMSAHVFRVCTKNYLLFDGSLRQITDPDQLVDYGYKMEEEWKGYFK